MADDLRKHLYDIREATAAIFRFVRGKTFADYEQDELLRSGIEWKFEIMVVSLDSVDEHEQARSEDARYTLLMHDTRSASGGSYGVHSMLLSTPAMHTLGPTRFWHSSGPLWS